jgi:hypothetical protein
LPKLTDVAIAGIMDIIGRIINNKNGIHDTKELMFIY